MVVADGESGEPLLRIRSADFPDLGPAWLASGDGMVLWGADEANGSNRTVIARIRPEPGLEWLPPLPEGLWYWPRQEAMVTASAGSDRFFAGRCSPLDVEKRRDGVALYDAVSDSWHLAAIGYHQPEADTFGDRLFYLRPFWPAAGGERELAMEVGRHRLRGGGRTYLNRTVLELPPLADEVAFRVARTGSCLRVPEFDGEGAVIVDCLPDGTRVVVSERPYGSGRIVSIPHDFGDIEWGHVRPEAALGMTTPFGPS